MLKPLRENDQHLQHPRSLTDLLIILLPMPVLKGLNMPFRQRVALMAIFALGGLWVVCGRANQVIC